MVASSVAPAAEVGAEILAAGGNAIDAAVAMGFAAGVAHQFSSGIGGGGFVASGDGEAERFRRLSLVYQDRNHDLLSVQRLVDEVNLERCVASPCGSA